MPTLYLIDGYAQFFRAYHAIRTPMSSPVTKEPTNMSFGFLGMLLKLLRGEGKIGGKPDFVAVTLDVSGDRGTFRTELYEQYKANRPPPPDDLGVQVDRCLGALHAIGMPILGAEGFEADDVIATLVTSLRQRHPALRIRIISKDKDLKQLLADQHVELFDIHHDEVIDEAALKADLGIAPSQVIDFLALMGDNADNVPGVEGVGPKTAAQLIAEYGSLAGVLAEAAREPSKIKGKRLDNIRAATSHLDLSRQLVSLRHDVPIELDLAVARTTSLDLAALAPVLRELGFNRYQDELKALIGDSASEGSITVQPASTSRSPAEPTLAAPSQPRAPSAGDVPPRSKKPAAPEPIFGGLFDQPAEAAGGAQPSATLIRPQSGEYRCIRTARELTALVRELEVAECIAVDTETTGLEPMRDLLVGVCLSTRIGTGVYIPVRSPTPGEHLDETTVVEALRPIFENPTIAKCGHNLKFDALVLRAAGVRLAGFSGNVVSRESGGTGEPTSPRATLFDSMIASYLIDPTRSSHGLDSLSLALLNRQNISIKDLIGTGAKQKTFDQVPLDQATLYASEDADVALQLRAIMLPQLRAMGLMPLFESVEMPLVGVLAELEWNGIKVDRAELERQRARLQTRVDELRLQIVSYAEDTLHRPFNPDSPKQLSSVLFNKPDDDEPGFGLKPGRKTKTGYSTDTEVLEGLAEDASLDNPIPRWIVEHRQLSKLVGTYLEALAEAIYPPGTPGTGRIHCSFNQTVASTGRLSASDPNLQNIPIRTDIGREIRKAFIAEPGNVLVSADYSQIELRLLAHLSRDPALIQAFHDDQDIHTAVAAQIHGVALDKVTKQQRSGAKMVNFGIVYGVTPFGLARRLGISNSAAGEIIDGYKRRFAGITTFLEECVSQARRFGYVETMLKRRRPITDIDSNIPSRRALAERMAINSVVQGSAADLIKLAMVALQSDIDAAASTPNSTTPGSLRMLLQIHDELVLECVREDAPRAKSLIIDRMQSAMSLTVPLKVDASIATNWFEGK